VNVRVAEQGFLPVSKDDDINDLVESFEPAANAILEKVDMELILHASLNPSSMGCISSICGHD
jgi:hypothetical protein